MKFFIKGLVSPDSALVAFHLVARKGVIETNWISREEFIGSEVLEMESRNASREMTNPSRQA